MAVNKIKINVAKQHVVLGSYTQHEAILDVWKGKDQLSVARIYARFIEECNRTGYLGDPQLLNLEVARKYP